MYNSIRWHLTKRECLCIMKFVQCTTKSNVCIKPFKGHWNACVMQVIAAITFYGLGNMCTIQIRFKWKQKTPKYIKQKSLFEMSVNHAFIYIIKVDCWCCSVFQLKGFRNALDSIDFSFEELTLQIWFSAKFSDNHKYYDQCFCMYCIMWCSALHTHTQRINHTIKYG